MENENCVVAEGELYDVKVDAKNTHGHGIGKVKDCIVFIKNSKTRLGKVYKVKITQVHDNFAYAEPAESSKYFIGNGGLLIES